MKVEDAQRFLAASKTGIKIAVRVIVEHVERKFSCKVDYGVDGGDIHLFIHPSANAPGEVDEYMEKVREELGEVGGIEIYYAGILNILAR